jgi:hypothetical protein
MKTFSNSLLAGLIVAALFWGNCFSCPQLLLSLAQKAPHGCCKRSAPVAKTCTTQVLRQFVKADPVTVAAPAAAPLAEISFDAPRILRDESVASVVTLHPPPGLLQLTSLLRI